jgi:hypothetical protein
VRILSVRLFSSTKKLESIHASPELELATSQPNEAAVPEYNNPTSPTLKL